MQSSSASDTEMESRARGISSSSSGCSSHRVGYNKMWEMKFPWLTPTNDFRGMLCALCSKHGMCNKRNGSTVWSAVPCTTLRKDEYYGTVTLICMVKLSEQRRYVLQQRKLVV